MIRKPTPSLGAVLRATRVAGGLSLRETAKWLDCSAVVLGEYERGVSEPADWRHVFRQLTRLIRSNAHEAGFDDGLNYDPLGTGD